MFKSVDTSILIVDDSETILIILRRLLKKAGFTTVKTALNATQALTFVQEAESAFAIILSDQHMPGMTGDKLFEQVLDISPDTRRLLMTGYQNPKAALKAINSGSIHRYITKPWDDDELISMLIKEADLFHRIQEKNKLDQITQFQTKQLFALTKNAREKTKAYIEEIKLKQELKNQLEMELATLKSEQCEKGRQDGLERFLKRTNVLQPQAFNTAFRLLEKQIKTLMSAVAGSREVMLKSSGCGIKEYEIEEAHYPLIDMIIADACRINENRLVQIGLAMAGIADIDNYAQVPDIIELAHSEGYLTGNSRLKAEKIVSQSGKKQNHYFLQSMLAENKLILRTDFSKVVVKQKLIEIRLKDKKTAEWLIEHNRVSKQDIQLAFAEQIRRFEENFQPVSIKIVLAESGLLEENIPELEMTAPEDDLSNHAPLYAHLSDPDCSIIREGIRLEVSEDKMTVMFNIAHQLKKTINDREITAQLKKMGVRSNIIGEKLLSGFLKHSKKTDETLIIARGIDPQPGKDADIEYLFDPNYQQAGIVLEDGTIDFRDRGNIPYVTQGDLLACKTPMAEAITGCDVFGESIMVNQAGDRALKAGKGAFLSDNGLEVYAAVHGRPNLDFLGTISVYEELIIKGDVGYETGHIDFQGNVYVAGCVNEGFHVKCVDLTAKEINGGTIDIYGNLDVSTGIVNARIKARGNIKAKFINHSRLEAFGNITIMRETLEATMITAGKFINTAGRVTTSEISAKNGMDVNQVGTEKSKRSILRVGIDDYQLLLEKDIEGKCLKLDDEIGKLKEEKKGLKKQNMDFHKQVVDLSSDQERLYKKVDQLKQQSLEFTRSRSRLLENRRKIQFIQKRINESDQDIKDIFLCQDELNSKTEAMEGVIELKRNQHEELEQELTAMKDVLGRETGDPVVKIRKKITPGNVILGPHKSMTLKRELTQCTILGGRSKFYFN